MKRLVIEALSLNYGKLFGYQEYLLNLLRYFKRHRDDINADEISIVCKEVDAPVFAEFAPEMKTISFDTKSKLQRYFVLNTLGTRLNLDNEDVILFTNNYSALTKQCKHILVIHDLLYLRKNYMPNKGFRIQRALFVPRSARIADRIIAISNWVKEDIVDNFHVDPDKVIPIYNNFDFSKFDGDKPTAQIREICEEKNYFLSVCSSAVHKNTKTVLTAYNKYKLQGGDKSIIFLGRFSQEMSQYVEEMPEETKKCIVNIHGISNSDLGFLYRNAFAYISASLFEGLGMPIVEAMYFGLPCIVSDIPVIREVTDNKAIYFNATDADELTRIMATVKKDKVKGDYQKALIKKMFSEENTSKQYIEVFNCLFSGGARLNNALLFSYFFQSERRAA